MSISFFSGDWTRRHRLYMRQNSVFTALDIEGVGREKTKQYLLCIAPKFILNEVLTKQQFVFPLIHYIRSLFIFSDEFNFTRKKKHPDLAYRSHEFFDPSLAPAFPTRGRSSASSQRDAVDSSSARERVSKLARWTFRNLLKQRQGHENLCVLRNIFRFRDSTSTNFTLKNASCAVLHITCTCFRILKIHVNKENYVQDTISQLFHARWTRFWCILAVEI